MQINNQQIQIDELRDTTHNQRELSLPSTRIPSIQQRSNRCSSTVKSYSPQVIRKELALIRSKSDDKVDELMKAVHKVQDLAFHLKNAEKKTAICLKKEEEVENLKRQLSFWQHMNAVQNEKITHQLETIAKGRDELAGLNEQIFDMQERLVKIRVKFGVGNKEHKAPSSGNKMTRIGRISASAEPAFKSFGGSIREKQDNSTNNNVACNPIKRGTHYSDNLLLENIEENNEKNKITTKRCWQQIPNIISLESPPVLQKSTQDESKTSSFNVTTMLPFTTDLNVMEVPKIDISDSTDDSSSDRNEIEHTGNGTEYHNEVAHLPFNGSKNELKQQSMKQTINKDKSYDEEDSFIKLLSEDDDPVNTDTDSDVRPHPVETEELDMIANIPTVIKHLSRSADIRKSRSISPINESENHTNGNLSSQDI